MSKHRGGLTHLIPCLQPFQSDVFGISLLDVGLDLDVENVRLRLDRRRLRWLTD